MLEEEFFRQGDMEKALKLPVSPLFDRTKPGVTKSQVGRDSECLLADGGCCCNPVLLPASDTLQDFVREQLVLGSSVFAPIRYER